MSRPITLLPQNKRVLLELRSISIRATQELLLDNVTLSISNQEIVTLIGPNGAGKSTLVKVALGLLSPDEGEVYRKTAIKIGYVPQNIDMDHTLPVSVKRFLTLGGNYSKTDILETLERVDVASLLETPLQKVSGGEMRRILLARALLIRPDLLILDEPTAGVDITGQAEMYSLIQQIRDKNQCGILLISHDLHVVMAATDKVICLNRHLCCTGTPEHVQQHPEFVALFGHSDAGKFAIYPHYHDHSHGLHGEVHKPVGHITENEHHG